MEYNREQLKTLLKLGKEEMQRQGVQEELKEVCMYVCMYVCMCVCVCVYVYVCTMD
jgi:hypothetical protein